MVDSPRSIGVNRRRMHTGQNPPPEAAPTKVSRFVRVSSGGHVDIAAEALFQGRGQQLWDVVITQSETEEVLTRGQLRPQNIPRPSTPPP